MHHQHHIPITRNVLVLYISTLHNQITSHIMNHLWHFPLGVGAQRLSSLVVEGDDVPGLTGDELSSEVFLSPHVQLFTLNRSCLLSLVQLPALQVPGGASTVGFKTPSSEVCLCVCIWVS